MSGNKDQRRIDSKTNEEKLRSERSKGHTKTQSPSVSTNAYNQIQQQLRETPEYITLNGFEQNQQIDAFLTRRCGQRSLQIPINGDKLSLEWSGKLKLCNVLVSAFECSKQFEIVQQKLAYFASQNEGLAQGQKVAEPKLDSNLLATLAHNIMILSRAAFVPAHRLCKAVIGLYMTEDFIRDPMSGLLIENEINDVKNRTGNRNYSGRIQLPTESSNERTLLKLKDVVELATDIFTKFEPIMATETNFLPSKSSKSTSSKSPSTSGKPRTNDQTSFSNYFQMREVLLTMRIAIQDLHTTGVGSVDLLNLFLYVDYNEKEKFAHFLNSLNSIQKSDLLEDISTLRRTVDLIPLTLEKLSWASCTVYRLASGCSLNPSPVQSAYDSPTQNPSEEVSTYTSETQLQVPANSSTQDHHVHFVPEPTTHTFNPSVPILLRKNLLLSQAEEQSSATTNVQQEQTLKKSMKSDFLNGNVSSSSSSPFIPEEENDVKSSSANKPILTKSGAKLPTTSRTISDKVNDPLRPPQHNYNNDYNNNNNKDQSGNVSSKKR